MSSDALLNSIERASRRSAILMALGALVVLAALWMAAAKLAEVKTEVVALESQAKTLRVERAHLAEQTSKLQATESQLQGEVSGLRQALAASRNAIAAFHDKDYASAVELYDLALAADPGNAYLMNLKAYSLFKLGKVQDALSVQNAGIATNPDYGWGYFDLARFQCAAGDKVGAAKSLALASSKDSRIPRLARQDGEFQRLCGPLGAAQ